MIDPPDTLDGGHARCGAQPGEACCCCLNCGEPRAECGNCRTPGCPEADAPHVLGGPGLAKAECCATEETGT